MWIELRGEAFYLMDALLGLFASVGLKSEHTLMLGFKDPSALVCGNRNPVDFCVMQIDMKFGHAVFVQKVFPE